ncbi:snRNA-activating protein complex subunit 3 [Araneus ventricosus]|uniref:snRNA-activating protein complex subunit 3 n=1 Tax=Araneus ventricosus TaxID=182803 RepID=A0A4Y2BX93_ARAVE|nr:snRNA-activating protein complex subunit 3 [Araneus ventricosus]
MEAVHKTDTRSWITSKINVKQFREDWDGSLSTFPISTKKEFKMTTTEYAELEKECGLATMKCPAQDYIEISKEFSIPEDVSLETLKLQKEDIERRQKDSKYEALVYCHSKNYNYPTHHHAGIETVNPDDAAYVKVQEPEVLLWVQVFRPEKRSTTYYKYNQARMPNFAIDQEFIVLGCQYLTELRDKIDCVSDKAIPGDYSDYPDLPPETTCKDLYKSGFFYIDGTFYNDMRHADCRDYSEPIISWAASSNRGIGPFRKALMEKSKFIDLDLQLGYPYVYVHQGDCEHLIVFSDLQYYTHHHCSNRLQYPLHVSLKPKRRVLCMICRIHTAEWIVFDNKRLPENPFYFCKTCFFSFNYDENNQKIGNFRAYHHIDRSNIL